MNDEPRVLHGPWTWGVRDHIGARIVESETGPQYQALMSGAWVNADPGFGLVAELARLAAENAELRERLEASMGACAEALEERDGFRALTARMLSDTGNIIECLRQQARDERSRDHGEWSGSDHANKAIGIEWAIDGCLALREIYSIDPDGQAAAEWLEAEKAQARADGQALAVRGAEGSSWLERERERATEPWKALAARAMKVVEQIDTSGPCNDHGGGPADCLGCAAGELILAPSGEAALAWLADREARARAAGRRQGLAEAAEHCRQEAEAVWRTAAGGLLAAVAKEIQALAEEGDK